MSNLIAPNQCVFIKVLKRTSEETIENDSSKKIIIMEKQQTKQAPILTESEQDYVFDDDDLIVYSPEGSFAEYIDENEIELEDETTEIYLQRENCFATSNSIPQCRECTKDINYDKYSCRFYEFRKIERNANGNFKVAGFLDPHIDPCVEDLDLWTSPDNTIDRDSTHHILKYVASQFCEMVREELNVIKAYNNLSDLRPIVWKRSVFQVREICDVCSTSLFNLHWVCSLCGTSVCIDCYKERQADFVRWKLSTKSEKEERDKFFWFKCHNDGEHNLLLTQIIAGDSMRFLYENVHEICKDQSIPMQCVCQSQLIAMKNLEEMTEKCTNIVMLQEIAKRRRKYLKPPFNKSESDLAASLQIYNRVSHQWISNGQILKFNEPSETEDYYRAFQHQWHRGKPIVVANVTKNMRKFIWAPEYFLMRFGNKKHSLINCENNATIHRVKMKHFYEGYESVSKRLPEECERKMVLKLKDWPTSSDFADIMKEHFIDLMKAVPFSAYTTRDGRLNLAKYLHSYFCSPDLGPKMYSAYGQELNPAKAGSTNLHLDVSDAINVLVHVSRPKDYQFSPNQYSNAVIKNTMEICGCDKADIDTFMSDDNKIPGAIWYIYSSKEADAIRKVLLEVARENGKPLKQNDDPLHNQDCFIDFNLRKRLRQCGIVGHTIVQWEGDAILIPAGAPHQVLNIFDCIKVALDFVSPENISECFNLTTEFRKLSSAHGNREDKLQIKNILYHVIKSLVPSKSEYDL